MLHSLVKAILFCLFYGVYLCRRVETITPLKNVSVSAVLAFGDSFVDQGNNNYINTLGKANFLPYGKDFEGGKPTGRFSNGRTIADILSKTFCFPLKWSIQFYPLFKLPSSSHKLSRCDTPRTKYEENQNTNNLLMNFYILFAKVKDLEHLSISSTCIC